MKRSRGFVEYFELKVEAQVSRVSGTVFAARFGMWADLFFDG
jgi:hypothetical protein